MEPQYTRRERRRTMLFAAAFALFVMIITGWGPLPMLAVLAGFGVLGLLHYVIWGRREEDDAAIAGRHVHRPGAP